MLPVFPSSYSLSSSVSRVKSVFRMVNRCCLDDTARPDEVGQVGQLHLYKKPMKYGTRPTWPTFFR